MVVENHIWSGSPSQITNLGTFFLCSLPLLTLFDRRLFTLGIALAIVALPYALWKYLVVKNQKYVLTSQRLKSQSGVLYKQTDELELYRVKDTKFDQPFFLRLFGLGNVLLISSDSTTPVAVISAVRDALSLREKIRTLVEDRRDQKHVRIAELE